MSAPDLAAQRAVLDRVGSLEREQSVLFARQARARAEMVRLWGADPGVLVELAGTARIGQDRAGGQLGRAGRLVEHFPIALGLLELGVMRVGTMEIVLAVTKNCRTEVMELLDERLSERLCELDAVDVRALVAATIPEVEAELDPIAQQERYEQARANRGVWAFPVEDGMARIGAELDQVSARRWSLDFEELVRAQKVITTAGPSSTTTTPGSAAGAVPRAASMSGTRPGSPRPRCVRTSGCPSLASSNPSSSPPTTVTIGPCGATPDSSTSTERPSHAWHPPSVRVGTRTETTAPPCSGGGWFR
jgi:hypothetical protein